VSESTVLTVFQIGAPLYLAGVGLALVLPGSLRAVRGSLTALAVSSALGLLSAVMSLAKGETRRLTLGSFFPVGALELKIDPLAAFFLVLIFLLMLAIGLYSYGYMARYQGKYGLRYFGVLLNLLALSLTLTVTANNAIVFLVAWETMAVTSYFLTVYRYDHPGTPRAAFLMTVIMEVGAGLLIIAFLLLYGTAKEFGFDAMREAVSSIPEAVQGIIFVCALFGFGAKVGIVPLHIWLPEAHPAAPSNVSAALSGVVVSAGIYGIARVVFTILGGGPAWWGVVMLIVGAVSAVLGVMYSMQTHDLKCLLSYSTVENMGIVLMLIGSAVIFGASGLPPLAALALLVGLYHTLNHAAFKGLLFLGAGSLEHATQSINMDDHGGLARRMPWTAGWCFVGTLSVAAIPPLNGFVTEWFTLQVIFQGFRLDSALLKILLSLAGAALALTIAMSLTIFLKQYGLSFLGMARSREAREARESPRPMLWGMGLLGVSCVGLGVLPFLVIPLIDQVTTPVWSTSVAEKVSPGLILHPYYDGFSAVSPSYLGFVLPLLVLLPLALVFALSPRKVRRVERVWLGGLDALRPDMQYSPLGFSNAVRIVFGWIYRPQHDRRLAFPYSSYYVRSTGYRSHIFPLVEQYFYMPMIKGTKWLSRRAVRFQSGSLNRYMTYIFLLLLAALLFGTL
jgi:hydrogenase-4 component B